MFTLTFTEPEGNQSHPLADGELLIGRDAGCDVVLRSKDVSRRHARFFVRGGALLVEDLGSQNGVFVRGARIEKPSPVLPGAPVEIGDVKVSVAAAAAVPLQGVGAGAVLRATGSGKQIRLPARAVVGRGKECEVVLDDDSVSRRHAELARDDRGLYRLRDLESGNGTFLDGEPVGKEPVLVPAGAKLRFGDVEVLFRLPPLGMPPGARQKILVGALGALILAVALAIVLRPSRQTAAVGEAPGDEVSALTDQAQAAVESERFDEAARLAQLAIDKDPLAPSPRKVLAQARREQQSQKAFAGALSKAQVGREDEALQLLAQVPAESRFFPRARIKGKDLALAVLRTRGAACRSAPRDNAQEVAEQCARALDLKCQQGSVDGDAMLKALRAAEKKLWRRVPWSCPQQLAPLLVDEGAGSDGAVDEKALAALYLDAPVRSAIAQYARGDVSGALRTLSAGGTAREPGAASAVERIKVVDGRFREGQTAMMSNALDRADAAFGEALQADAALMPAGTSSFFGRQIRSTLSRAHGKAGDDKLQRLQYASAYDEYGKGLAVSPNDPHLLDQLARLEKVAENILGSNPGCTSSRWRRTSPAPIRPARRTRRRRNRWSAAAETTGPRSWPLFQRAASGKPALLRSPCPPASRC